MIVPIAVAIRAVIISLFCCVYTRAETALRVTIISVSEFSDEAFEKSNPPQLAESIKSATNELRTYFKQAHNVDVTVLEGVEKTTGPAIRTYLNKEYTSVNGAVIQLVFVLSHGFPYIYPGNAGAKSELFIATSEATDKNYLGTALKGTDLVTALSNVPAGSSVFLFLDTCYSGSIGGSPIRGILQDRYNEGLRFMILASSSPNEGSYSARLSRGLVQLWRSAKTTDACPSGDSHILDAVQKSVDSVLPQMKQTVEMPFPYGPEFCIQSFAADKALVLVYNPYREPVDIKYRKFLRPTMAGGSLVRGNDVRPLPLDREVYNVSFAPSNPASKMKLPDTELDLNKDSVIFYELGPQRDLKALGEAKLRAADIARRFGSTAGQARRLVMEGNIALAKAGAATAPISPLIGGDDPFVTANAGEYALALNYSYLGEVKPSYRFSYLDQKIREYDADPLVVASLLSSAGDYATAASLCKKYMGGVQDLDLKYGVCAASNKWLSKDPQGAARIAGMLGTRTGSTSCDDLDCQKRIETYKAMVVGSRFDFAKVIDPGAFSYFSQISKTVDMHAMLSLPLTIPPFTDTSDVILNQVQMNNLLVRRVESTYPSLAKQARLSGVVEVEVTVDETGKVISVRMIKGHPMLVPSALDAAKQYQFRPYVGKDGKPRSVKGKIQILFGLK